MPTHQEIITPLGHFATMKQAAAAHHCDRATLVRRCEQEPDQYRRVKPPPRSRVPRSEWAVPGVRWPISWNQYRLQDHDTREAIWQQWCDQHGLSPDLESTATAFFDEMDSYTGQDLVADQDQDLEMDLDEKAPTA